jgi:short-subunit dehydrogenase
VQVSDGARGLAIITGASSGIGAAFARALAARHHPLLLVARRGDRLRALARELRAPVSILELDLLARDAPGAVVERARTLGPVELLINNAGFGSNGAFLELDGARELDLVRLDAEVPLVLARLILPSLVAQGRGGVINISSIGAFQPVPYMATYGAAKAFLLSLTEALAEELRDTGVRALAVCPGPVATEFFDVAQVAGSMAHLPHMMSADELVARALDAFADAQVVTVPGAINFATALLARLAPRALVRKVARLMFQPRAPRALPAAQIVEPRSRV